ncbi:MAG: hypothetical protein AAB425_14360 [Bdellovibrionota bacterium]
MVSTAKLKLFSDNFALAVAASKILTQSLQRAAPLFKKPLSDLDPAAQETLEALASRYARLSDLITHKIFRTLDQIELVDDGSLLDRLNRAEKRKLIDSASTWRELRELRNEIAHEYVVEPHGRLISEVARTAPQLITCVENVSKYADSKGYLA